MIVLDGKKLAKLNTAIISLFEAGFIVRHETTGDKSRSFKYEYLAGDNILNVFRNYPQGFGGRCVESAEVNRDFLRHLESFAVLLKKSNGC